MGYTHHKGGAKVKFEAAKALERIEKLLAEEAKARQVTEKLPAPRGGDDE